MRWRIVVFNWEQFPIEVEGHIGESVPLILFLILIIGFFHLPFQCLPLFFSFPLIIVISDHIKHLFLVILFDNVKLLLHQLNLLRQTWILFR